MTYSTYIDTIGIQIDCNDTFTQHEVHNSILGFSNSLSFYVTYKDYPIAPNSTIMKREYYIHKNNTTLATIKTGFFTSGHAMSGYKQQYYVKVLFAGLKSYNSLLDKVSQDYLFRICAYLNDRAIRFKLTELDLAIDMLCPYENVLAVCTKKSPKTKYYKLGEIQKYATTTWIEDIPLKFKRDNAVLRSYVYDKTLKEASKKNYLQSAITRWELKLQAKYFNKYGFSIDSITKALNRYHVMYFNNVSDKNSMIAAYNAYSSVQKREIKRLGFDNYRITPNIEYIQGFIETLLSVRSFDLAYGISNYK